MKKIQFLIYLFITTLSAYSQDYTGVVTKDSLAIMSSVTYITNDKDMNIFIGYKYYSENGVFIPKVAKWDGTELYIYSSADNLEFGVVRSVLPSKNGYVWLATANGLRKIMDDGKYIDYLLPQNNEGFRIIDDGQFTNMVEDSLGIIYFQTNLYLNKDIYNKKIYNMGKAEIWSFDGKNFIKSNIRNSTETVDFNIFNDNSQGNLLLSFYSISSDNTGSKLISYNSATEKSTEYQLEDFLKGKINVLPKSLISFEDKLLISYKPSSLGDIYEGFSILDRNTKKWTHFGASPYIKTNPNLSFNPIPSAINLEDGNYFPQTNWANKITPAKEKGFWLSMNFDYKSKWLLEKGGGLLYFDGDESFIRYSPGTHEGIKPFRPNINLKHPSDGLDYVNQKWDFGTGVAYDKNGDLFVGVLSGGLWIIPKSELPKNPISSVGKDNFSKHQNKGFLIIPNVVSIGEPLRLSLSENFKGNINSISITDQIGRVVATLSSEQLMATTRLTINTSNYVSGMYFVNMIVDNNNVTQKFIVR